MLDTYPGRIKLEQAEQSNVSNSGNTTARAYVQTTFNTGNQVSEQGKWRATLIASIVERSLAGRWAFWLQKPEGGP